jgi:redox-sensitive bicupin YhaK (pirin superfamily)
MKKKIRFSVQDLCTSAGDVRSHKLLPNKFVQAIGPFVFLQHIFSSKHSLNGSYKVPAGKNSRPYRGIVTLTYIISGEVEHVDSIGNHMTLSSGGMHWTNTGKGIVQDEAAKSGSSPNNPNISILRFWVNLPSARKLEKPDYLSFRSNEIPEQKLEREAGWIKILLGGYGNSNPKVPCYSKEFLYHIHLEAGKQFSIETHEEIDCAVFLVSNKVTINNTEFHEGKLIAFTSHGEIIELYNSSETATDIIQFGGEHYNEPIVAEETFVMNTPHEITQAYNDFYDGKYGQISDF